MPPPAQINISPPDGVMYDTIYTVKVLVPNPELHEYIVIGLLADGTRLRLTDQYISCSEFPEFKDKFPQLSKIRIEVRNTFGEISAVE